MKNAYVLILAALLLFSGSLVAMQAPAISFAATPAPVPSRPAGAPGIDVPSALGQRTYVGSLACRQCHAAEYERWCHTRMANIGTDP